MINGMTFITFQVEDMFEKDQEIFKNIGKKLSEVECPS